MDEGINISGICSVILFYILILAVGLWAARKKSSNCEDDETTEEEEVMLAGRNIGMFVGVFTMTATWVGGGYINGTAEIVYNDGLIWCQAPFGYALSLMLGGIFFANKMRSEGYVTMLDPLQDAYGERMGGLLFLPALCGEVFWSAGILAALGATLAIIIQMDIDTAVVMSALIAIFYTWIGGLYSVAYTDVVQLGCIFLGLWICIPFAWVHPAVTEIQMTDWTEKWMGEIGGGWWNAHYVDYFLLLTFGGIPWQVYFQRVLSSQSAAKAEILSYIAAGGCIIMAVPPVLIGGIAKATDWNQTSYSGVLPIPKNDTRMILPMVLQHLTPSYIAFFGLGAVSAAVMSSADSSVLSAASMFARNVYKCIFRQKASEREIMWVMRVAIFIVGGMATVMALTIPTIYGLWALCSDLVYVILFPQLLMVVHFRKYCNTYGSLFAYCLGAFIRFLGGEKLIKLPPVVHFPGYAEPDELELQTARAEFRRPFGTQRFPFRTMAMVLSMISLISVSLIAQWLFDKGHLKKHHDVFKCIINIPEDEAKVTETGTDDDGEMIGMTANSGVKTYHSVDEMNGRVPLRDGVLKQRIDSTGRSNSRPGSGVSDDPSAEPAGDPFTKNVFIKQKSMDPPHSKDERGKPARQSSFETKPDGRVPTDDPPPMARPASVKMRTIRPLTKGDRRESVKQLKKDIKEGAKEVKEVIKEVKQHLPDGHRGSIASVTERPRYKLLDKQDKTKQTEL